MRASKAVKSTFGGHSNWLANINQPESYIGFFTTPCEAFEDDSAHPVNPACHPDLVPFAAQDAAAAPVNPNTDFVSIFRAHHLEIH